MKLPLPLKNSLQSCLIGLVYLITQSSSFGEITPAQVQFFETKIRPVLADACYECHSKESGKSKGGLTLDTKVGLRLGGNTGPGLVPFKPRESILMDAMLWRDNDLEMPPEQKLPTHVLNDFRKWIEMGAPDPRDGGIPKVVNSEIDIEEGRKFWSFQKPQKTVAPRVNDPEWGRTDVDRFIYAKLQAHGMTPAKVANPSDLVRRISYDLAGLPPTLEYVSWFQSAWERDPEQAISVLVDRLMASPQFGERWGKHWLDVARFAESNGKQSNHSYPQAWRYRDYVIDAFNSDKPYNWFIAEQLAGDLLGGKSLEEKKERMVATGFLAIGPKDLALKNERQLAMEIVDDQINATMLAFQGLTVACARCHDHKTDPIPTADYYSLAGIFLSSKTYYGTAGSGGRFNVGELLDLPLISESMEMVSDSEKERLQGRLAEVNEGLRKFRADKAARKREGGDGPTRQKAPKNLRMSKVKLENQLEAIGSDGVRKDKGMGVLEQATMVNSRVLIRGEVESPAQEVQRGVLQVMNHLPVQVPENQSGRLQLAQWIASENNPLTARVVVNRVWAKLFGQGIVPSTENFGNTGQPPSHPELLDHLALEFMEEGWSIKTLVRKLMLTRAYRMSTDYNQQYYSHDPENVYLWRATPRRLDGEEIRDSILAVSGNLDYQRPNGSIISELGDAELGGKASARILGRIPEIRSVYLPVVRENVEELVRLFDGADASEIVGHRTSSNVASQALYMMNNDFILKQSRIFAEDLVSKYETPKDRLNNGFIRAFGRLPTSGEFRATSQFYNQFHSSLLKETQSQEEADKKFWNAFCQGLLSSAEFRYLN